MVRMNVITMMAMLFSGISEIHAAGLAHYDLKPRNIIVTDTYLLKIIDFGIAAHPKGLPGFGTKFYAAPEVGLNNEINVYPCGIIREIDYQKADVWSAGVIFYELAINLRDLPKFKETYPTP